MTRRLSPLLATALLLCGPTAARAVTHGDLVSKKTLRGAAALSGASKNFLVTYRSVGASGKAVRVTGVVSLPKGRAPRKGWPVFTYAHGTTGTIDACAPSRDDGSTAAPYALGSYHSYVYPFLNRVLAAGFAVVRTDYEGLGGPGDHPYLNGLSAGHSVLDIVRAARKVDSRVDNQFVIGGHSQGGHAALWAASLAKKWTSDLRLKGTVAFAPANHLGEQGKVIPGLDTTSFSGLIALILRGAQVARPALNVESLLSDRARALLPQTRQVCLPELGRADSWGGLPANQIFRAGADLTAAIAYLDANDPERLTIRSSILLLQGDADTTVLKAFTDQLVPDLRRRGAGITYKTYAGVNHGGIVTDAKPAADALAFIRKRR